ncbi:MAG TPA: VOC family protein [Blastocatellia bacterium]|nr:VOC family protein [Blastocatellia bacterium]
MKREVENRLLANARLNVGSCCSQNDHRDAGAGKGRGNQSPSDLIITSKGRSRVQLLLFLLGLASILLSSQAHLLARGAAFTVVASADVAPRSFPANGTVAAVEAVGMTVSDVDRSVEFFSKVLSFEKVSDVEVAGSEYEHLQGLFGLRMRVVRMKLGDEFIELTEYLTPRGRPVPVDSRSNDRWFQHVAIITSDMDRAYEWLRKNKVQHASTGPQKLPETIKPAAGIRAFYFKDPDGHALEVLQFPADKGAPKWHQRSGKLFLGIDHTAIVVSDTDASLRFYRDALGMKVAGESENFGTEQEHLNNVFGARLSITALRADSGPGIEFLEYLAPRDGRPMPADEKASDLIHWQTRLVTADASAIVGKLRAGKFAFVSPGLIQMPDSTLGFAKGFLGRDPDGHVMQLVEK